MLRISNPRGWARGAGALAALAAALITTACHGSLLEVKDVDVTAAGNFVDATAVPALEASAVNAFVGAYENFVLYTGTLGDEWVISGTFPTRIEVDQRDIDPGNATLGGLFGQISRARAMGDFARQRMDAADPSGSNGQKAEVSALAGLSLVLMSESYCAGTPISHYDDTQSDPFQYGGPLTNEQVLDTAITHFDDALAVASAGSDYDYLARIGKARALVDRGNTGDYDAAAALVATVPTTWLYTASHSAESGQSNNIWSFNISQERFSVTDQEGGNGLPYLSSHDPRMLWDRSPANDVGFDRHTPSYNALKYSDRPAWTVIADGVEARLIEAEAALSDGDADIMLQKLNELRAEVTTLVPPHNYDYNIQFGLTGFTTDTLPQLAMPATYDEQVDLLFQERAYWLWLTSHRLSDMRRLIRQYGRSEATVFPVGLYEPNGYSKGGSYGTDVNFPIPVEEANNPNTSSNTLGQCTNRDA